MSKLELRKDIFFACLERGRKENDKKIREIEKLVPKLVEERIIVKKEEQI